MKKIYMYLLVLSVYLVFCFQMQSCNTFDVEAYNSKRALFFETYKVDPKTGVWSRSDAAYIFMSYYPGKTEVEVPFKICLIGDCLPEDTDYEIIVVDSLTTAKEGMVTLPDKFIFRKGVFADSLWLTIHGDKMEKDKEYVITCRLIGNSNFNVGYKDNTDVQLRFNNKNVKPLWWDDLIVNVYLGKWSPEKFETFVIATEITSMENMEAWEKRLYSLKLKNYIALHGITEANGTPMVIPAY